MDPFKFSVLDLFVKPERYVIPLYQRRYIWTKEKQWRPLWEDIQAKVAEVMAKSVAGQEEGIRPHFLGAIVVSKRQTAGASLPIYDVVDDQQRLTTFQVFLLAFRDQLRGKDDLKKQYGRLRVHTRNGSEDLEVEPEEQYKVWPTRFDQPMFAEIWGHADPQQHLNSIQQALSRHEGIGNIKQAYAFFSAELQTWLSEDAARADTLLNTLKQHLQVVRIDLLPGDDPQVIFESLNARGEPLQAADLIRNFIFQQVDHQKLGVEEYFQKYWAAFDEDRSFWRELVSRGRVRRDQLTWCLTYFLTVQHAREISEASLFQEFKVWWQEQEKVSHSIKDRLDELLRYANAYLKLMRAAPDTRLGLLAHRLEALDTTTLTPLLLFLLTHDELPASEFNGIVLNLESYLVRRFTCGLTSKNYNQRFLTLLARLKGEVNSRSTVQPALTTEYVRRFLSEGDGDSVRWPDDEEFLQHLTHDPLYRTIKPRGVVMLLEAAELVKHTDKQEKLLFTGKSTVEHVMPRRWESHWTAPDPVEGVDETALVNRRHHLVHTLGNLTLLTHKLNSSLSNSAFKIKRPAITQQTLRLLNSYFQDFTEWNEEKIEERSAKLAQDILTVWPAPALSAKIRKEALSTAASQSVVDNLSVFDQWLKGDFPQYWRAEPYATAESQGVQFVPRQWSRNWKIRVYAYEEAGLDRLTLEIREDFGSSDPTKSVAATAFMQMLEPLRLSLGDLLEEVADENRFVLHLDPDATAEEIQTIVNRVMAIFIPRIARALWEEKQPSSPYHLDALTSGIWPLLPDGFMLLPVEMDDRRYRRIPRAGWKAPADLHFEVRQKGETVVVALDDEVNNSHPLKAKLRQIWPQLQAAAQAGTQLKVVDRKTTTNQVLEIPLPLGVSSEVVANELRRLIQATEPVLTSAMV